MTAQQVTKSRNTGRLGVMNIERAAKTAAKKLGISTEQYLAHRANNERWCYLCQQWHPETEFYRNPTGREYKRACRKSWLAYYNNRYQATNPRSIHSGGRPATCTVTEVLTLQKEGLTRREIALQLGCSYSSVGRALRGDQDGFRRAFEREQHKERNE